MYVDAQTIILAGGIVTAVTGIVVLIWKLFKWINHQKEQDAEIKRIDEKIDKEIQSLRSTHVKDQKGSQEEQAIIVYGLLACLKGLAEKGCNGPVSEAIVKIEKHINQKAHEQK